MIRMLLVFAFIVVFTIVNGYLEKHCSKRLMRKFVNLQLAVYLLGNLYFTILSRKTGSVVFVELRLFQTYFRLFGAAKAGSMNSLEILSAIHQNESILTGFILNILLYYPLGYLLPCRFEKIKAHQVIIIGFLVSIATELTQYVFKMGWCETDDVLHNVLGTAIGVLVWRVQSKCCRKPAKEN